MSTTSIEVRHQTLDNGDREFDEVIAKDAYVHLEKMGRSQFCLIVETRTEHAIFFIGARRAPVDAWESSRDPINRRSDGQRKRWARLMPDQRTRRRRR